MSYPILKAKDGNEFYNNFLGSIEKFTTKYIAPQLFGKKLVLYEGSKKRKLTQKEIETYVKIYLLPKLYLFYSRISYTFTLNIKGYYEYYYDSLNNFNNLCRFYLNKENPVVRKINFDIHTKMKKEQKNVNSNTSFYDVIIKNNEEVIGILEIFENILDKLVNKNKAIRLKYTNIMKLITDLKADYVLLLGKDIIEKEEVNKENNNPNFLDKINKMITNLGNLTITNPTEYDKLNNKIKLYKTKYLDFLKKYQSLLLTLKTLDINITGFNLDEVIDFDTNDTGIIDQISKIYVKSFNLEQIYGLFRKDILDKIKKIKEKNTNIQLLKSIKKNNSTYEKILEKIIKTDDIVFLKEIPEKKLIKANKSPINDKLYFSYTDSITVKYDEIKNDDFFKLLFYSLAYIRNNMIKKFNFFNSTNPNLNPTDELVILDNTANNSTFLVLKKSIEKFQKTLEEKEGDINEEIKNTNDTKDELKADLDSFDTKKYAEQIKDITDKITEKKEEIKKLVKEISALDAEIKPLKSSKSKKSTPANQEVVQEQIDTLEADKKVKEDEKNDTIPKEIVILENEKKKFSLLTFREETNIELINKKIKLQDELLTKYETLKKSNPFEKFKSEDFIIFDESLKKFRKNIDKVTQKTSTSSPIVSYFKQNYLYYSLFFNKNRTTLKNPVTIDLKELLTLKLFFSKSKPQIIKNENKEKNPQINEDFMSEIFKFIDNTTFIDFLKNYDKKFKDTITKLLKENRKDTKFNQLASTVDTEQNIQTLVKIITSCIEDESKTYTNKTKIYPYTNFIIAYFAIYLIIINLILENLNK
jgi:hypothetical protein